MSNQNTFLGPSGTCGKTDDTVGKLWTLSFKRCVVELLNRSESKVICVKKIKKILVISTVILFLSTFWKGWNKTIFFNLLWEEHEYEREKQK